MWRLYAHCPDAVPDLSTEPTAQWEPEPAVAAEPCLLEFFEPLARTAPRCSAHPCGCAPPSCAGPQGRDRACRGERQRLHPGGGTRVQPLPGPTSSRL